MIALDLLVPFLVASALFACVPGPGMLYAAVQTVAQGRRAGWLSMVGFHLGAYVHIAAAAFGLSVLLQAVPPLFLAVKLAGATYLVWLGLRLFLGRGGGAAPAGQPLPRSAWRIVRQSVLVEILNPKTALFFLAFLPQFAEPAAALPLYAQILVLGVLVNLLFSATDLVCILLAAKLAGLFRRSQRTHRLAQRVCGGVLMALGVELAAAQR